MKDANEEQAEFAKGILSKEKKKEAAAKELATLEIQISFDPSLTDAQTISTILDGLLDTALSTVDILDECGDPSVGISPITVQEPEDEDAFDKNERNWDVMWDFVDHVDAFQYKYNDPDKKEAWLDGLFPKLEAAKKVLMERN